MMTRNLGGMVQRIDDTVPLLEIIAAFKQAGFVNPARASGRYPPA
jgi:hypothetical protein